MVFMMSGCYATRVHVGDYRLETQNNNRYNSVVYYKGYQCHLFWGLIPLGRVSVQLPQGESYEIKTHFGFGNFIVSALTGGVFSLQTVKVRVPQSRMSNSDYYYE